MQTSCPGTYPHPPPPALQPQNCSGSEANNPLLGAGTVAYLSPVPCSKFYRFTWWITW